MNKKILKIAKWSLIAVLLLLAIVVVLAIHFLNSIELSDCAFSPIDQKIIIDTTNIGKTRYILVLSGGVSWQDKTYDLEVYSGDISFDECGVGSKTPIKIIEYSDSPKCVNSVKIGKNSVEAKYAEENAKCAPLKDIKIETQ